MKREVPLFLGLALCASPLPARADPSISAILSFTECKSCHGGGTGPTVAAKQGGFQVLDPATNGSVSEYEPGKTYTIRMRFQGRLFNGSYRNSYLLWMNAGSIIDNGQIGLVKQLRNARVLTTPDPVVANTMDV